MCGISGITWKDEELVRSMSRATSHRGPDGTGFFGDEKVTLGHNLLAITDTPANCVQPIVSKGARYVLVYNGEIYNYRVLREELGREGDVFLTDSDTEVLFAGLVRHGAAFLDRLDGMYAVAFYDAQEGSVLIARDPAGIKPLYWTVGSLGLMFSSEIRGLLAAGITRTLDSAAAELYLTLGYVPGPSTLLANVRKVCPGQYLRYHVSSGSLESGWVGFWRNTDLPAADELGPNEIREIIGRSVRSQAMGLRPFGLYLSGGMDSSVILHELASANVAFVSYTTRFSVPAIAERDFNEDADSAQRLSREYGIEHQEILIRDDTYFDAYESAIRAIEEPRWNPGIGAYWLLACEAARQSVVVLNGSGGDELFFGYPKYLESRRMSMRYQKFPDLFVDAWYTASAIRRGRIPLTRLLRLMRPLDRWAYLNHMARGRVDRIIQSLESIGYPALQNPLADLENAIAELDRCFWLADEEYLRTDKISMRLGMEGRFPLMGRDVVRCANALPAGKKIQDGSSKALLRAAYRGHLPRYIIDKPKTGWKAPVGIWMDGRFGELVRGVLSPSYYRGLEGFLDFDALQQQARRQGGYSTRSMKRFLPEAALQIWAHQLGVTL